MRSITDSMAHAITGRVAAWLIVAAALLGAGALIALGPGLEPNDDPAARLPADAQSTQVALLQQNLPSGELLPAIVVYSRPGGTLSADDLAAIVEQGDALGKLALGGRVSPPQPSADSSAALVVVPLSGEVSGEETAASVAAIRETASADLPEGVIAQVTGAAGFLADLRSAFAGADLRLLITTATVVAVLLLVTYRSPILWIVPLAVVGLADQVTAGLVGLLSQYTDLAFDESTSGIVSVLVFGAGTDYALLLIARYREELRKHADRRDAMRSAWLGAAPAILASGVTVILALLTLLFAAFGSTKAIGVGGAVGIVVALIAGLVVLPAALALCPRGLFWPFVPQVEPRRARGHTAAEVGGRGWRRIGEATARRPWPVVAGSVLLLVALSLGVTTTTFGLNQADTFRTSAESVDGLETVSAAFPAGTVAPAAVLTDPAHVDAMVEAAAAVEGVSDARPGEQNETIAQVDVVLSAAPDTPESFQAVRDLRSAVAAVDPAAVVGGTVATSLDARDAAIRDLKLIAPMILVVVLLVLMVLLRALVAPVVLIMTVILSFFAALGAGSLIFTYVLDFPGLDYQVPLLSFLFLVALGVDYNIFLISRARDEAMVHGTRDGVINALALTGGVITSAGILLAAVFTVLGVLPVIVLTEIGIIVGIGVLLDTLLVRTVLVPALVQILGERFWLPGHPAPAGGEDPTPQHEAPAADSPGPSRSLTGRRMSTMRIGIAGGTGTAGRVIAARAGERGHEVAVLARSTGADVSTGEGLDRAIEGCAAVVDATNLATVSRRKATDFFVGGTEQLLAAEHRQGVGHHLLLSIVGVDKFALSYYQAKLAQERAVVRGSQQHEVPCTIARVAQFHDFAPLVLDSYRIGPLVAVPAMHIQPVHLDDVAAWVLDLLEAGPAAAAPDLIGPQPEELLDIVRRYAARPAAEGTRRRRLIVPLPLPPAARRANEAQVLRPAAARRGTKTFDEWLAEQA